MEFGGEVVGQAGVALLLVHLLAQPGDLPGHLAVLSMLEVRRDVRDDVNADGPVPGIGHHRHLHSPVDSVKAHPIPSGPSEQELSSA